ncbi:hypothetical protein A1359_09570 [Methylomonas lenta]|uniref:Uncharacterized protein n=1 Tax=Methylomonas lenta TaxID=980561 RepID=A0A177NC60_9GAMM|nr:hypothetical protein [Methylomonas lenta]OAI15646.1 hypothetical protein A1359_09570 [Methylomonas lenta]
METFLFILAIVLPLCLLIAVFRLNTVLSNIQLDTGASCLNDKALLLLNNRGKWLTLFGCAATLPLVMGLIFDADNSVKWIVNLGVAGCLAMIGAASLLIPALLGFGISRHIQVKLLVSAIGRVLLKNMRQLIRNKVVLWWFAGALVIAPILFAPIFQHLANGVVYLIGFILVARIGLVDEIEQDFEAKWGGSAYNYATGKWDDGYQEGGLY